MSQQVDRAIRDFEQAFETWDSDRRLQYPLPSHPPARSISQESLSAPTSHSTNGTRRTQDSVDGCYIRNREYIYDADRYHLKGSSGNLSSAHWTTSSGTTATRSRTATETGANSSKGSIGLFPVKREILRNGKKDWWGSRELQRVPGFTQQETDAGWYPRPMERLPLPESLLKKWNKVNRRLLNTMMVMLVTNLFWAICFGIGMREYNEFLHKGRQRPRNDGELCSVMLMVAVTLCALASIFNLTGAFYFTKISCFAWGHGRWSFRMGQKIPPPKRRSLTRMERLRETRLQWKDCAWKYACLAGWPIALGIIGLTLGAFASSVVYLRKARALELERA